MRNHAHAKTIANKTKTKLTNLKSKLRSNRRKQICQNAIDWLTAKVASL